MTLLKKELCRDYFNALTQEEQNAVVRVAVALREAKIKHPKFSHGKLDYGASIVIEEAGELVRATNRFIYETGGYDDVDREAAQTGATAIRMLCLLQRKRKFAHKLRRKKPVEFKDDLIFTTVLKSIFGAPINEQTNDEEKTQS